MTLPELGSDLLSVALRTAIVYGFLVGALRLAGKREIGQLSILDLVVLLVIADAVQNAMVGENTTLWGGLVAATTLILIDRGLRILVERVPAARKALESEPRLLVRDGTSLERALREEGVTPDELGAALRENGLARAEDAALVVLETDGRISVVPKDGPGTSRGPSGPAISGG